MVSVGLLVRKSGVKINKFSSLWDGDVLGGVSLGGARGRGWTRRNASETRLDKLGTRRFLMRRSAVLSLDVLLWT